MMSVWIFSLLLFVINNLINGITNHLYDQRNAYYKQRTSTLENNMSKFSLEIDIDLDILFDKKRLSILPWVHVNMDKEARLGKIIFKVM